MVDLERLQEHYEASLATPCDETDEAIVDMVPDIIAELTALRAKVAAGEALRELLTKAALNGWLLLLPAQEQLEILQTLEACDNAAVKP